LKGTALGLLIGTNATAAFAMCPHPTPTACSAYFESDAVFVATVVSEQRVDDYLRFGLRVSRVLRGKVDRSAVVYSGDDSACSGTSAVSTWCLQGSSMVGLNQGTTAGRYPIRREWPRRSTRSKAFGT